MIHQTNNIIIMIPEQPDPQYQPIQTEEIAHHRQHQQHPKPRHKVS